MLYQTIIQHYKSLGKRREAGFVNMYYLENKTPAEIVDGLFLNSMWTFYKLKKKVRSFIESQTIGK